MKPLKGKASVWENVSNEGACVSASRWGSSISEEHTSRPGSSCQTISKRGEKGGGLVRRGRRGGRSGSVGNEGSKRKVLI